MLLRQRSCQCQYLAENLLCLWGETEVCSDNFHKDPSKCLMHRCGDPRTFLRGISPGRNRRRTYVCVPGVRFKLGAIRKPVREAAELHSEQTEPEMSIERLLYELSGLTFLTLYATSGFAPAQAYGYQPSVKVFQRSEDGLRPRRWPSPGNWALRSHAFCRSPHGLRRRQPTGPRRQASRGR